MLPKKWNSSTFLHRNLFQRKKAKTRVKRPNEFFKANQPEMKPEKGQLNFFRSSNFKRGQISEIWPKKANLATLATAPVPDRGHSPTVTKLLIEHRVTRPPHSIGIFTIKCKRSKGQCDVTNPYCKLFWNL